MKRKIYQEILNWKNSNIKKPLMIIGSRQIGKTYIIEEFCKNEFENHIEINLQKAPKYERGFRIKSTFNNQKRKSGITKWRFF